MSTPDQIAASQLFTAQRRARQMQKLYDEAMTELRAAERARDSARDGKGLANLELGDVSGRLRLAMRALEACAKFVPAEFRWQQAGQEPAWVSRREWELAVEGLNACGFGAAAKASA